MDTAHPADTWATGDAYEPYVGRWSRLAAREFLAWLAAPSGWRWLDVGCGTGALSVSVLGMEAPSLVKGVDPSAGYIAYASERVLDQRVTFTVGAAQALDEPDAFYDAVVSGLVLNFVEERERAVAEMARVARLGGVVAAYVWDYAGQMQLIRHFWDAAVALDPAARDLDEGQRFLICQPEPLAELFSAAKLQNVEVSAIDVVTRFRDFDDYWLPFLGGEGPAPGYLLSLDEGRRIDLRERARAGLPFAADGSLHLIARAWAVRGQRYSSA